MRLYCYQWPFRKQSFHYIVFVQIIKSWIQFSHCTIFIQYYHTYTKFLSSFQTVILPTIVLSVTTTPKVTLKSCHRLSLGYCRLPLLIYGYWCYGTIPSFRILYSFRCPSNTLRQQIVIRHHTTHFFDIRQHDMMWIRIILTYFLSD